MPSFIFRAIAIGLLASSAVSAVDISLHNRLVIGGSPCSTPPVVTCPNIAEMACCGNPAAFGLFRGVLFTGLAITDEGQAHGYNWTATCGSIYSRGSNAVNLCVSCSQSPAEIQGGRWESAPGLRARELEPETCDETVMPSIAHIDGHDFSIYHDVAEDVSNRLVELAASEEPTAYEDIPSDLLQYEMSV